MKSCGSHLKKTDIQPLRVKSCRIPPKTNAEFVYHIVDVHYAHAKKIQLVLDNLNTHTGASLYEAFAPEQARRMLERLELHNTPKHANWLNMAGTKIGIMSRQCLNRRIDEIETIRREIGCHKSRDLNEVRGRPISNSTSRSGNGNTLL